MSQMYTSGRNGTRRSIKSIVLAIIIIMAAFNIVTSYQEKTLLADHGYSRLINVGDYKLNITVSGNPDGEHRLVGISGLRHGDFAISASKMTDLLSENNQIVIVDRAGYGLSDDTLKTPTVAKVVEDYRAALTAAGIKAPYILFAEHFGGVYATYWEVCYPSEIEAIVFFDGTEMHESEAEARKLDKRSYLSEAALSLAAKVGFSRLLQSSEYPCYPTGYSLDEQTMGEGLTAKTLDSLAPVIEMSKQWDNIEKTYSEVSRNTIPKLYITSDERWASKAPTKTGGEYDFGKVVRLTVRDPNDTLTPYLDQMGNCRLTYVGGVGHLYEYRPDDCANIIKSFLNNLEHYKKMAVN